MKKLFVRLSDQFRSQKGSVFVLVAAAAMTLVVATGVSVDMARAQVLQMKMASALDAAGLAAGATASTVPNPLPSYCGSSSWVQCQAQKYFTANFPTGYLQSGAVTVVATLSADNATVSLTANTTQQTTFMKIVGYNQVAVAAQAQVTRASMGMELVLVLDNTGSMGSILPGDGVTKLQALKTSVTGTGNLLDILYGSNDTLQNFWVGVVPFAATVNIGTGHPTWMDTTFNSTLEFGPVVGASSCPSYAGATATHYNSPSRCSYSMSGSAKPFFGQGQWSGCLLVRSSPYEESDQIPSGSVANSKFKMFNYASDATGLSSNKCTGGSNGWNCSKTTSGPTTTQTIFNTVTATTAPNANCMATPVLSMRASKAAVVSNVNSMVANGSTMINLGMNWGWRMLSPNWAGRWGGEMDATGNTNFPQLPLAYHTPLMNKVLILMTDGMNNPGSATGSAYQGQSLPSTTQFDNRTKTTCDALKNNGVIIYTIGFGTDDTNNTSSSTSVNGGLLKYCATQLYTGDVSHYFLATSSVSLAGAFQQIGASLANLRISQ